MHLVGFYYKKDYIVYGPVLRRYKICTENGGKESQQFM
jgi:hypothetical protein